MNLYSKIKSELWVLLSLVVAWANAKYKLGLDPAHVLSFFGLVAILICKHWHLDAKFPALAGIVKQVAGAAVLVLALGVGGCANVKTMSDSDLASFVQAQAQGDVQLGLSVAAGLDPAAAAAIKVDAITVAKIIDGSVIPLINAPAADLPASILNTATTTLSRQIAGIKNGPMIVGYVRQALSLVQPMLGLPSTPAVSLPPRTRLALVAFFTGASQGISAFADAAQ